ncbi:hypothetical protein J2125_000401 [Erwinia toletana]|uniref:Uncharacterized protein n=1 Tax=Winslowiella toletana TaxID=92490 RepID=A0ABS4P3H3_9GAMM|nr:hypothetical protein [Winslowiella toletana]
MSWICRLSRGRAVTHRGEGFLRARNGINADVQRPCGATDARIIHSKVNNLLFDAKLVGTISIIKLESLAAHLAPIALMFSFSQTMLFKCLGLTTKRAFYVNLAIRYTQQKERSYFLINTLNT